MKIKIKWKRINRFKNGLSWSKLVLSHQSCFTRWYHCMGIYGHVNELSPVNNMFRISVSIGVFPTKRTKKSCSMTWELTVRSEGKRSNNLPNRVGWFGYCVRQYSSRAHCDFSWRLSIWLTSVRPQASVENRKNKNYLV